MSLRNLYIYIYTHTYAILWGYIVSQEIVFLSKIDCLFVVRGPYLWLNGNLRSKHEDEDEELRMVKMVLKVMVMIMMIGLYYYCFVFLLVSLF